MVGLVAVGLIGHLTQTGFMFSSARARLKPKMERLNPAKGLKKLLSPQSAWEAAKVLLRTSILAAVAVPPVRSIADELMAMGHPDLETILGAIGQHGMAILRNTSMAGLLLAVVDYGLQKRRVGKMLKMSKQDIKDESRQSEGDPHTKAAIRGRQQEMSRNRMMAEVRRPRRSWSTPRTSPSPSGTRPAARRPSWWPRVRAPSPCASAKEGERHHVPIMKDVPLARALHSSCDIGQEIPVELYEAVARVLAMIMALQAPQLAPPEASGPSHAG